MLVAPLTAPCFVHALFVGGAFALNAVLDAGAGLPRLWGPGLTLARRQ